ncbi:(deoxy)nucleoside triphosphate pyrophosphohydrolase [Acidithiobacillus sp. IBUN Pt1247-S3]|uniref:(deoxy)nucleoside triphosphate pyrophosphohydrolase n=1 Tax=Acidithiobacillus sp. IBUN Pt1247-S3 TaxID=3166642 RepID=UPI0034E4BB9F
MKTVTAAIVLKNRQVLLTRRASDQKLAGFWEFPGGKVEEGESLQECLQRELREELGVSSVVGEEIVTSKYHYQHGAINLVAMSADLLNEDLTLSVHDKAIWVPLADLMNYQLAPADIPIAAHLQEKFGEV